MLTNGLTNGRLEEGAGGWMRGLFLSENSLDKELKATERFSSM